MVVNAATLIASVVETLLTRKYIDNVQTLMLLQNHNPFYCKIEDIDIMIMKTT